MKFYSEKLNKVFDTAEECQRAEFEVKEQENRERIKRERAEREAKEKKEKILAERKAKAAEVKAAREAMIAAQSKYRETLEAFCDQFGTYHESVTGDDAKKIIPTLFNLFNPLFFDI